MQQHSALHSNELKSLQKEVQSYLSLAVPSIAVVWLYRSDFPGANRVLTNLPGYSGSRVSSHFLYRSPHVFEWEEKRLRLAKGGPFATGVTHALPLGSECSYLLYSWLRSATVLRTLQHRHFGLQLYHCVH